jgi:hypothetical protein
MRERPLAVELAIDEIYVDLLGPIAAARGAVRHRVAPSSR